MAVREGVVVCAPGQLKNTSSAIAPAIPAGNVAVAVPVCIGMIGDRWPVRRMVGRSSADHTEQVVQAWMPSEIWWDFYDDGELFFRTVFRPDEGEQGEGRDE